MRPIAVSSSISSNFSFIIFLLYSPYYGKNDFLRTLHFLYNYLRAYPHFTQGEEATDFIEAVFLPARAIRHDTLEQEGYYVTWATTGLEGLADFQTQPFDLVLVDWMLPEMDGLTVSQNIRWESDG